MRCRVVRPKFEPGGKRTGYAHCRYLGLAGNDVLTPAIAVAPDHTSAVLSVIVLGPNQSPGTGYAIVDSAGANIMGIFPFPGLAHDGKGICCPLAFVSHTCHCRSSCQNHCHHLTTKPSGTKIYRASQHCKQAVRSWCHSLFTFGRLRCRRLGSGFQDHLGGWRGLPRRQRSWQ